MVNPEPWLVEADPLLALLRQCVVRVDGDGSFRGSGFLVAPGEVLTCAHVVHGIAQIKVLGAEWESTVSVVMRLPDHAVEDPAARFYPLPDVALLRLEEPPPDHPCVGWDLSWPVAGPPADVLRLEAFTKGEHGAREVGRSPASPEFEGTFEEASWRLVKLKGGQVLGGFSGCPALNTRTGGVCALIDSSRDPRSDLGGFGIPIAQFLAQFPGLADRNATYHQADNRWRWAVHAQARAVAERSGLSVRLPLVDPLLELDWRPGDPASDLLCPRYRVVPLTDRDALLAQLTRWRDSDGNFDVLLLTGRGGAGKTRLAAEACAAAARAGWTAGFLHVDDGRNAGQAIDELAAWRARLFVVIDDAETRPDMVGRLALRLLRSRTRRPPARLVLVVRQPGSTTRHLEDLFATGGARDELAAVIRRAERVSLERDDLDRSLLLERAAAAFARFRTRAPSIRTPPSLHADHFTRPLFLLTAALLTAQDAELEVGVMSENELMLELLDRHEAEYWARSDCRLGLNLDPGIRAQAVALAALLGADSEEQALALVHVVPGLKGSSAERARAVARWLRRLYGHRREETDPVIVPLEPDVLAEALVAREMESDPRLIGEALDIASEHQLARALLVMSRTAAGRERFADAARAALSQRLKRVVQQLVGRSGPNAELLTALTVAIRILRPLDGAVAAFGELAEVRDQGRRVLTSLAGVLIGLVVEGLRAEAEAHRDRFLPDLVTSLDDLSGRLGELDRSHEVLAAAQEAVEHGRLLAEANPDRFRPDLAMSLSSFSEAVGRYGEHEKAIWVGVANFRLAMRSQTLFERLLEWLATPTLEDSKALLDELLTEEAEHILGQLGEEHRDMLTAMGNLALTLSAQGELGGARELQEEVVKVFRRVLGEEHRDTLTAMGNLALTLSAQGELGGARELQEEVVKVFRRVLGEEHRDTLTAMGNLALTLSAQGELGGARELQEEVVKVFRRVLDEEHRDMLTAMGNLALTLSAQGELGGARELQEEVVKVFRRVLGEEHPATLTAMGNLAGTLRAQGELGGARELQEEVVKVFRRVLGEEHPATLTAINNLAGTLRAQGELGGARELQEEVVKVFRRVLGEEHPATLTAINNLMAIEEAERKARYAR